MSADDWDDDLDDGESDAEDWPDDDDGETLTISCPNCGADIYEDAEQCPHCGEYVERNSTSVVWAGRPGWWILLGGLGIIATIIALTAM
jgi:predicted RNA-binding Zn-ribbon protein involved in translation (DUF1610 family)